MERGSFGGPISRQTSTDDNYRPLGNGESVFPRDKLPYWLPNSEWSALKVYTSQQYKWTQQVAVVFIHIYVMLYVYETQLDDYKVSKYYFLTGIVELEQ